MEIAMTVVFTVDVDNQDRYLAKDRAKRDFKENFNPKDWIGLEAFDGKATVTNIKAALFIDGQQTEAL